MNNSRSKTCYSVRSSVNITCTLLIQVRYNLDKLKLKLTQSVCTLKLAICWSKHTSFCTVINQLSDYSQSPIFPCDPDRRCGWWCGDDADSWARRPLVTKPSALFSAVNAPSASSRAIAWFHTVGAWVWVHVLWN